MEVPVGQVKKTLAGQTHFNSRTHVRITTTNTFVAILVEGSRSKHMGGSLVPVEDGMRRERTRARLERRHRGEAARFACDWFLMCNVSAHLVVGLSLLPQCCGGGWAGE